MTSYLLTELEEKQPQVSVHLK